MFKFINVLEVAPYSYATKDYDSPNVSYVEDPNGWYDYWKKSLKDSHLQNLEPIEKGSFLVDIATISDLELKIVAEKNSVLLEEDVNLLCGGIVLIRGNEILIMPSCCGDLENLSGWEQIPNTKENEWTKLWIGHPWVYYKKTQGVIKFSDYSEGDLNDAFDVKFEISENILNENIKIIRENQNVLLAKITKR